MRADRLVAILLMLQSRGQVTAAEVAAELEVSPRTARRDLDALGVAGLPIYSRQWRNGGWQLIGGARTDLSGLSAPEARALFLVAGPSSTATPEVKAALRKLVRALPEPFRNDAEAASTAVVTDPTSWGSTTPVRAVPVHLEPLQAAVIESGQVRLGYVDRQRQPSQRIVHPLGLATKGSIWYLIADTAVGLRTFRVDRVTTVERTGDRVVRPPGFVLADAWQLIADEVDQRRTSSWARATVDADRLPLLRFIFGSRVRIGAATDDGRVAVEVGSFNAQALAVEVAGLGSSMVVDGPPEVVAELAEIGRQLIRVYGSQSRSTNGGRIVTAMEPVVVELAASDTY
ncbi:MAG: WYL domain-containing protein, partial [Ilumatobacteraceae bacterium]